MKKRILSVLLTLVMLIGLVTVMGITASAATIIYTADSRRCLVDGEVSLDEIQIGDYVKVGVTIEYDYKFEVIVKSYSTAYATTKRTKKQHNFWRKET